MDLFEKTANVLLVDTFNHILKYEEKTLNAMPGPAVTVGEAHLIENIAKFNDAVTVSDIAIKMNVSVPTATVAIKKLVKKGFATKTLCEKDNRRQKIALTECGKEVEKRHSAFHLNMIEALSGGLSDNEKSVLISALNKLIIFFDEKTQN